MKERSISLMLTRILASEGMSAILLFAMLRYSKWKYWLCSTSTGINLKWLLDRSNLCSLETLGLSKIPLGISDNLLWLTSRISLISPENVSGFSDVIMLWLRLIFTHTRYIRHSCQIAPDPCDPNNVKYSPQTQARPDNQFISHFMVHKCWG